MWKFCLVADICISRIPTRQKWLDVGYHSTHYTNEGDWGGWAGDARNSHQSSGSPLARGHWAELDTSPEWNVTRLNHVQGLFAILRWILSSEGSSSWCRCRSCHHTLYLPQRDTSNKSSTSACHWESTANRPWYMTTINWRESLCDWIDYYDDSKNLIGHVTVVLLVDQRLWTSAHRLERTCLEQVSQILSRASFLL